MMSFILNTLKVVGIILVAFASPLLGQVMVNNMIQDESDDYDY